jgi:tetratricopeptide (TPR) repeat protein
LLLLAAAWCCFAAPVRAQSEREMVDLIVQSAEDGLIGFALDQAERFLERYPGSVYAAQVGYLRCDLLRRSGRVVEARRCFLDWLAAHPGAEEANALRLDLALQLGKSGGTEEARRLLVELLAADPSPEQACVARYTLGRWALSGGAWRAAAGWFRDLVDKSPCTRYLAPARWGLAEALQASGALEKAARAWEAVLKAGGLSAGQRWRARLALGECRFRLGRYEGAADVLTRALGSAPRKAEGRLQARYMLALSLWTLGRRAEAVPHLRRLWELSGPPALREEVGDLLVRGLLAAGEHDAAAEVLERYLGEFPDSPRVEALRSLRLGLAARSGGPVDRLRALWALRLGAAAPLSPEEWASFRAAAGELAAPQMALGLLEILGSAPQEDRDHARWVAGLYEELGDWTGVEAWLLAALRDAPPGPERAVTLQRLGLALLQGGDPLGAIAVLQDLLLGEHEAAGEAQILFGLGRAHLLLGSLESALAAYERIERLGSEVPASIRSAALADRVTILLEQQRWRQAIPLLRRQLAGELPDALRGEALYWLGRALERTGREAEAAQVWREALDFPLAPEYRMIVVQSLSQLSANITNGPGEPTQ